MDLTTTQVENEIWKFLSRIAYLTSEDYRDDIRPIYIADFYLITYKIVDTKMGKVKQITSQTELPFRTRFFFNDKFTDIKRAYEFFNPENEKRSKEWLVHNVLRPLGRFNLLDWCGNGLIAHKDAIEANYSTEIDKSKKVY